MDEERRNSQTGETGTRQFDNCRVHVVSATENGGVTMVIDELGG